MIPRWLLWTVLAVVSWGIWAIFSKLIGDGLTANHSQALSTLGLVPVIAALGVSKKLRTTGNRIWGAALALGAGVLTCLGNAAYYDVLNRGAKAATVVPLTALYPLVTILLAVVVLREKLNRYQLAGLGQSFAAIYLFNVAPGGGVMASSALVWILAPILLWGVAALLQKISTNHISGELATLWFLAAFVPVAGVILWREPLPAGIATKTWLLVAGLGFFFAIGNFALLEAFASGGKASIISPIAGLYPLVSVPIAILWLGESIGGREAAAIVLALAGVVALSLESKSTSQ